MNKYVIQTISVLCSLFFFLNKFTCIFDMVMAMLGTGNWVYYYYFDVHRIIIIGVLYCLVLYLILILSYIILFIHLILYHLILSYIHFLIVVQASDRILLASRLIAPVVDDKGDWVAGYRWVMEQLRPDYEVLYYFVLLVSL